MTSLVFGSLPFSNQGGDQIVSKAVSTAIAALFKRTGKLEAKVRAEPIAKLLQGSIDGFDFIGNGMLMYNGLRLEAMELYVQAVSIDFSAIFTGQVKLRQPIQASMRVILTEEDLTTSFNTPFVVEKLQRLEYQGQSLHFHKTQMILQEDRSLRLKAEIKVGAADPLDVDVTAFLNVEDRTRIQFVDVTYQGTPEAQELGKVLIAHVNDLMDLEKFAIDGTQLKVDRARIKDKQIVFYGVAQIDQFPQKKLQ
jgi:hypothetical protein